MDFTQEASITRFRNVTNATAEVALNYLMVSDGDVEQAITLFFESGADVSGLGLNPQRSTSGATSSDIERRNIIDSDAELARALAEQESSTIRAPIAPKRDILVGDQNDHFGLDGGIIRRDIPRSRRSRDNNAYRTMTFAGDVHRMGPSDEKATRLADLFSPPFELMNKEDFEKTRTRARNEGKWVMVDIQNIKEFACQVLNRDLWRNKTVKDVIRAHFLFLQYNSESADGRQYVNFYPIDNYPHIAIIDPRTGERVKVWNTPIAPTEFIISVTDFLERYSLNDQMRQTPTPKKNVVKSFAEMSEEEQLLAVIEESRKEKLPKQENSASEYEEEDVVEDIDEDIDDDVSMNEEPISTFDSIQAVEREEAKGPTSAMIKFRLADGQPIIRRFDKSDPVRYLFEFIKASVPSLKNQQFELVSHKKSNLIDQIDQTVEEAGLPSSLVNVVSKD